MHHWKLRFSRRSFRLGAAFLLCLIVAMVGYAANSAGKPTKESEVPGSWSIRHSDSYKMWWDDLSTYSTAVYEKFTDPDLKNEFGDHPAFTSAMRAGEEDPTATVKVLTTAQMNTYLESLPRTNMTIRYYGEYPQGLRMPVLIFSKPKLETATGEALRALGKPIYYLRAQVHGNEIGASAGALLMAQRLSRGHSDWAGVLDKISIVIMPCMNLDGTKIQQRGTSLVSGDVWINESDYYVSEGPGGGKSQYYDFMGTGRDSMVGFDQNRDNMWLSAPASRINARVIGEFRPDFALDAHEYGCGEKESAYFAATQPNPDGEGFLYVTDPANEDRIVLTSASGADLYWKEQMTTQYANNLMIPEEIRSFSETIQKGIVEGLGRASNSGGVYYWAPYVEGEYGLNRQTAGVALASGGLVDLASLSAAEQENMRRWADAKGRVPSLAALKTASEGGFDPGTGRNTMAFTPAFSFLAESRSAGGRWEMERRTMGQYLTNLYYVRAILDNFPTVTAILERARNDVRAKGRAENIGASNTVPIVNAFRDSTYSDVVAYDGYLGDGSTVTLPGNRRNARFGVISTLNRTRPYAYIIDGDYEMADEIAFRMSHYDFDVVRLAQPTELEVQALTVTAARTRAATAHFGLANTITESSVSTVKRTFPAGSYIYYMEQEMAGLLPLYFEPESPRSWIGKDVKNNAVILGKVTPFYRYMVPEKITPVVAAETVHLDFDDVVLQSIALYSPAKLAETASAPGLDLSAGESATYYGTRGSELKLYLPDDAGSYGWHFLNVEDGSWQGVSTAFDRAAGRWYTTLGTEFIRTSSDPYFGRIELVRSGSAASGGSSGSSGTCSTAPLLPAVLLISALLLRRKH